MISRNPILALPYCFIILSSLPVFSAEISNKSNSGKKHNNQAAPLIIQSQVKGSQEQPKVIYIMPWQGVDKVIEVKGKKRIMKLPNFKPINPREFREQVRFFVNKSKPLNQKH